MIRRVKMNKEDAFEFMFIKNEQNPKTMWNNHRTIKIAHDELLHKIYDDFELQLINKNLKIAELQGRLEAMEKEVYNLHPNYCTCMLCKKHSKKD